MFTRRCFVAAVAIVSLWPSVSHAQSRANALSIGKVYNIGFLYPGPQPASIPRIEAFSNGLKAAGIPAAQINIIPRVTAGDPTKLAPMAADLVDRNVDLILAVSPAAIRAAKETTRTVPIVVSDLESDPVASGFVASNARPGGNITGCFLDFPDFSKKWLEALKEVADISIVAVLWDSAGGSAQLKGVEAAAETLGIKLIVREAPRSVAEIAPALRSVAADGARALLILPNPVAGAHTKTFAQLALEHKLPSISLFPHFAHDGGLMAYGPNLMAFFHQIGGIAAKVLRGANTAELPIETPNTFEFMLNLKTAKALGITIPATTMLRADAIID